MSDVVRRLVALDTDGQRGDSWIGTAEVTNAAAGATTDGRLLITVTVHGAAVDCAYLDSYAPTVGDYVTFLKAGPSLLVIGRPATA